MFTQLSPPLPLDTPKGAAWAVGVIDYGPDHDLLWVTFVKETGECWTWANQHVRQSKNVTYTGT